MLADAFAQDPRAFAEHWCHVLPPGGGLIEGVTIMMRALMRAPRLEMRRDRVELFPDCPALAFPRSLFSPGTRAALIDLESPETASRFFRGRASSSDGDFRLFAFGGDAGLADAFDPTPWIEAFARAMIDGAGEEYRWELSEICRGALLNALALEPAPTRPPDVIEIERKYGEAVDSDFDRDAARPPLAPTPTPPRSLPRTSPRFMKPLRRPEPSAASNLPVDSFARSDGLERELEEARALEKAYLRARDLRRFVANLVDRIAQWS